MIKLQIDRNPPEDTMCQQSVSDPGPINLVSDISKKPYYALIRRMPNFVYGSLLYVTVINRFDV